MTSSAAHRPWPTPRRPWVMAQTWHDLLFAHWPVPAEALRRLVPASLPLDTFEGQAWLGVVPFRMSGVRPRAVPPLPWLSAFPELNVRTYVTRDGRPGVFFFSLDAGNRIAAALGRRVFHLPYYHAHMSLTWEDGVVRYASRRVQPGAPSARFRGRYRPIGPASEASPGSLADWLTARYCLYAAHGDTLFRCEIDHAPWPLQPAEATLFPRDLMQPLRIEPPAAPPLLHFSRHLQVRVWPLERLG